MRLSSGSLFKARRPKQQRSSITPPSGTPRASSPTVRVARLPATLRRALSLRLPPKRAEAAASPAPLPKEGGASKKGSPPKTRRRALVLGGGVAAAGTPKGVRRAAAVEPAAKKQRTETTPARAEAPLARVAASQHGRSAPSASAPKAANRLSGAEAVSVAPAAKKAKGGAGEAQAAPAATKKVGAFAAAKAAVAAKARGGTAPQGGSGAHQQRAASAPEAGRPQQGRPQQGRTPDATPVSRANWTPGSWRQDARAQAEGSRAQAGSAQAGRAPLTPLTPSQAARPQGGGTPAGRQQPQQQQQQQPPRQQQQQPGRQQGSPKQGGPKQQGSAPGSKAAAGAASSKCDKCDGAHATAACPHFRKSRDAHPDAQRRAGGGLGGLGGGVPLRLRRGRVAGQPGDGSCLFHSLRFGLQKGGGGGGGGGGGHLPTTQGLRRELAQWVAQNSQRKIAETPLALWVKWDSGQTPQSYADSSAHPRSLSLGPGLRAPQPPPTPSSQSDPKATPHPRAHEVRGSDGAGRLGRRHRDGGVCALEARQRVGLRGQQEAG